MKEIMEEEGIVVVCSAYWCVHSILTSSSFFFPPFK